MTERVRVPDGVQPWVAVDRGDHDARVIADRHYSRHSPGAAMFAPPGRALVLRTDPPDALWITSWPYAEFTRHEWAGAWTCSAFRNEGVLLSSDLIRNAVAATRARWPDVPELGMVTFVDGRKVRHKRDPGRCFLRAGFEHAGYTKDLGLRALQLRVDGMPDPLPALEVQSALW